MAAPAPPPPREEASWGEAKGVDDTAMPSCTDDKLAYRRLRLLGQGSFGKAFLARDLANDELCVMKQVRVERMDAKARDTAVREAVALRRVRHPNVIRFRQVFVRSGWLCLVMDFADGGDLCAAVKERARSKLPFEESAVLECFAQVADAVCYVHSQKMVHRDIKSRNIFLCRTGKALLGDFGLVRLLETTCELAHTRVGTPYYLSPEIIRKQPYNYKTDIWSLGVLLYEMAALTRPFVGTLETLPKVILRGAYEPLGSHYSQGLHDLVAGMLNVDPIGRLDLAAALHGEVLRPPLMRSREALGLEAPPSPEETKFRRPDRMRQEVQEAASSSAPAAAEPAAPPPPPSMPEQKGVSEWIGYNTMVRVEPILPAGPAAEPVAPGVAPVHTAGHPVLTAGASVGPGGWSMAPVRDPDSGGEDDDASSDSWGSVVDTGVDALRQIAGTEVGEAA